MSAHTMMNVINTLNARVNKMQKKIEELEGGDPSSSLNNKQELPVHNGKKVYDDMQDTLDSSVQRLDYLENYCRELKKFQTCVNDDIRALKDPKAKRMGEVSASSYSSINPEDLKKMKVELRTELLKAQKELLNDYETNEKAKNTGDKNDVLNGLKEQVDKLEEKLTNELQSFKTSSSNAKIQYAEINAAVKSLQSKVQTMMVDTKKDEDVKDVEAKVDMFSQRLKGDIANLQDKIDTIELDVERKVKPVSTMSGQLDDLHKHLKVVGNAKTELMTLYEQTMQRLSAIEEQMAKTQVAAKPEKAKKSPSGPVLSLEDEGDKTPTENKDTKEKETKETKQTVNTDIDGLLSQVKNAPTGDIELGLKVEDTKTLNTENSNKEGDGEKNENEIIETKENENENENENGTPGVQKKKLMRRRK